MNSLLKFGKPLSCTLTTLTLHRFSSSLNYVFEKKEAASFIHPTAVVHPNAVIGQGVAVGPFCTIGSSAKLGNGCHLHPSSHIFGNTELGNHCILMTGAVVGDNLPSRTVIGCNNIIGYHALVGIKCQDLKYKLGDECFLDVWDNNEIREFTSIHRSSKSSDRTVDIKLLAITILSWGLVILHMTAKLATITYLLTVISWQAMSLWRLHKMSKST